MIMIVLVDESRHDMNVKLEKRRDALDSKGFNISCTKIEYMNYNFSGDVQRGEIPMRIESLGDIIQ